MKTTKNEVAQEMLERAEQGEFPMQLAVRAEQGDFDVIINRMIEVGKGLHDIADMVTMMAGY